MGDSELPWYPLSVRSDPARIAEYEALHEGIPSWLHLSIRDCVSTWTGRLNPGHRQDLVYAAERACRLSLGDESVMMHRILQPDGVGLDVLEFVVRSITKAVPEGWEFPRELEALLAEGGSAWRVDVSAAAPMLERRVDETVTRTARAAFARGGRVADLLRRSWEQLYGVSPHVSDAYRSAARAMEAALKPVVSPDNSRTTLGTIRRDMEAKPSKWTSTVVSIETVIALIAEIWTEQHDRHADDDESKPLTVSYEEAEAALHGALAIVQWVNSGAIRRA